MNLYVFTSHPLPPPTSSIYLRFMSGHMPNGFLDVSVPPNVINDSKVVGDLYHANQALAPGVRAGHLTIPATLGILDPTWLNPFIRFVLTGNIKESLDTTPNGDETISDNHQLAVDWVNGFFVARQLKYKRMENECVRVAEDLYDIYDTEEPFKMGVGPIKRLQPLLQQRNNRDLFALFVNVGHAEFYRADTNDDTKVTEEWIKVRDNWPRLAKAFEEIERNW